MASPLRIAFDLDGVLADMEGALLARARELFGESAVQEPPVDEQAAPPAQAGNVSAPPDTNPLSDAESAARLALSPRQERRLWAGLQATENFWESLAEMEPGAVARLAAVAAERRWEVIFLTKRPDSAGHTAQVQTQHWLESKGFTLPSVFVVQGSRGRIAAALDLDVVVDDRPENCLDVVTDSSARAILVWRDPLQPPAAVRRLGIGSVASVGECLDILIQADSAELDRPTVLMRVRKALGLQDPTRGTIGTGANAASELDD